MKQWKVIGMKNETIGQVEAADYSAALTTAIEEYTEKGRGEVADVELIETAAA